MAIPIFRLDRQYSDIQTDIDVAMKKVAARGVFVLSDEVSAFEAEFASFIGMRFSVGVASGTDALTLVLRAYGIGAGDEVILPANVYPTAFGVAMAGVSIRLADCGEDGLLDVTKIGERITKKTKAIIPVHLYGNTVDIAVLKKILVDMGRGDIRVIEDCAQAHGALLPTETTGVKQRVGSAGDASCFSFYPSKNLGAYGDGGMICTNDPDIEKRIRKLRMYGETDRYRSEEVSGVSRLDELQAAILRVKLRHLDAWTARRRTIFSRYKKEIGEYGKNKKALGMLPDSPGSVFHLAVVRSDRRDELKSYLEKNSIGCAIHYPVPIHLTPSFSGLGYKRGEYPVAETLSQQVLSIPVYPELTDEEVGIIIKTIHTFISS